MKTILVPTDFSPYAVNALNYALEFAKIISAKVEILNVMQLPHLLSGLNEEQSMLKLQKLREKIQEDTATKNIQCAVRFKKGNIVHTIFDFVKENKVNYIVIGTKGANVIQETFIGSVAKGIMHNTECPVLAIPVKAKFEKLRKMVLAVDYRHSTDVSVLKPLKEFAEIFNAEIQILNVMRKDGMTAYKISSIENEIEKYLSPLQCSFDFLHDKDITEGIMEYLLEKNIMMTTTITKHYHLLEKIFHKSITDEMVLHTTVPLFVLHEKPSQAEELKTIREKIKEEK